MNPVFKSFPATLDVLPDVLACVDVFQERVDTDTLLRVQIAVEELFTNVVEHGSTSGSTVRVWLAIANADERVKVRFEDSSPPFDPFFGLEKARADLAVSLEQRKEDGVGRLLIQQLADSTSYSRAGGRNCIDMTFLQGKDRKLKAPFPGCPEGILSRPTGDR